MKLVFISFWCFWCIPSLAYSQSDKGVIDLNLNGSIIKNTTFNDEGKIKISQKTPTVEIGYYYTEGRSININFSMVEVKVNSSGSDNLNAESGNGFQGGLGYFFQGYGETVRLFGGIRLTYQGGKVFRVGENDQLYLGVAGGLKYTPVEGGALVVWTNFDKDIISEASSTAIGLNIGVIIRLK